MHNEKTLLTMSESNDSAILDADHKLVKFIRSETVYENQGVGEVKSILQKKKDLFNK